MENKIIEILKEHGLYEYPYSEGAVGDLLDLINEFYELKKGKYEAGK